jgi:hypothetical protein
VTIIGDAGRGAYVLVVAPESATKVGEMLAGSAAVNETGQFVLWSDRAWTSAPPALSSEYRLVDVDRLPPLTDSRWVTKPGRLVYPTAGAAPDIRGSEIVSVGDATFAFLALSARGGAASVVGLRVGALGEATVVSRPLTATDFTDRSVVDAVAVPISKGPGPSSRAFPARA